MKINKILTLLGVGVMVLTILSTTVEAVESNSHATINFTTDAAIQPVLDPDTLDQVTPEEGEGTTNTTPGLVTLDFVSNIEFGTGQVSTNQETYISQTLRPFVQVTDISGTGNGWQLTAINEGFVDVNGEKSLEGAVITLNNGILNSKNQSGRPTVTQNIVLDENASQTITTANQNEGMGTWITHWIAEEGVLENQNITLIVPAGTAATGSHTAEISWTLTQGPLPTPEVTE